MDYLCYVKQNNVSPLKSTDMETKNNKNGIGAAIASFFVNFLTAGYSPSENYDLDTMGMMGLEAPDLW